MLSFLISPDEGVRKLCWWYLYPEDEDGDDFEGENKEQIKQLNNLEDELKEAKSNLDKPYELPFCSMVMSYLESFKDAKRDMANRANTYNINNAWLKMHEMLIYYPQLITNSKDNKKLFYFDNAAFPGSFLLAVHHHIKTNNSLKSQKFEWRASSLLENNNISRPLEDSYDLFKNYPKNWMMTNKNNGDVTKVKNIKDWKKKLNKKINLYTSDLGFGVSHDYNAQEVLHMHANFGQIIAGIAMLADGGNLVTKQYTFFHPSTISMIAILSNLFDKFYISKPETSKPDNSEIYLIGIGLKENFRDTIINHLLNKLVSVEKNPSNIKLPIFPINRLSDSFMREIVEASQVIYGNQIKKINKNIKEFYSIIYEDKNHKVLKSKLKIKKDMFKLVSARNKKAYLAWLNKNPIQPIMTKDNFRMRDAFRQR
jgi:hypothetical protein